MKSGIKRDQYIWCFLVRMEEEDMPEVGVGEIHHIRPRKENVQPDQEGIFVRSGPIGSVEPVMVFGCLLGALGWILTSD